MRQPFWNNDCIYYLKNFKILSNIVLKVVDEYYVVRYNNKKYVFIFVSAPGSLAFGL